MNLQAGAELALLSVLAHSWTGFVCTAAAAVEVLLPIYFDDYTFVVMILFSSDGLCVVDHERKPNDVYWPGKGKIHIGNDERCRVGFMFWIKRWLGDESWIGETVMQTSLGWGDKGERD